MKVLQVFLAEKEERRYFFSNGQMVYFCILTLFYWEKKKLIYSRATEKQDTIVPLSTI